MTLLAPDEPDRAVDAGADEGADDGVNDQAGVAARPRMSRTLTIGLATMALLFVVRFFVAEPVRTDGDSMWPTLHDGDALVVDRLTYDFRDPRIGEIVVAVAPDSGHRVVKRVVALGGDSIGIEDGLLVRNGVVVDEPYTNKDQMGGFYWGPVVVPAGQVFLLGDNRPTSVDSRQYGPVSLDRIEGRYAFRIWPF